MAAALASMSHGSSTPQRVDTKVAMLDKASATDYKLSLVWAVVSLRADTAPYNKITSNMNQTKLLFLLITALAFASCRPTARQAMVDAEQTTDSTEAVTSADTLRLVIIDKSISRSDSLIMSGQKKGKYGYCYFKIDIRKLNL